MQELNEEKIKKLKKAGEKLRNVLNDWKEKIKPGMTLLEIAEGMEKQINDLGAKPAFPVNLSLNAEAAHRTAMIREEIKLKETDLLKVDAGLNLDGLIMDAAFTIDLSEKNKELIKASKEALENAIKKIGVGVQLREIGKTIEETINSYGFKPIKNLSGHVIEENILHAGVNIPNYDNGDERELNENMLIAIEPFASTGTGLVHEFASSEIYQFIKLASVRSKEANEIMQKAAEEYKKLPFAKRWIAKNHSRLRLMLAFKELIEKDCLKEFAILKDEEGSLVSQAETTILITKEEVIRLV